MLLVGEGVVNFNVFEFVEVVVVILDCGDVVMVYECDEVGVGNQIVLWFDWVGYLLIDGLEFVGFVDLLYVWL